MQKSQLKTKFTRKKKIKFYKLSKRLILKIYNFDPVFYSFAIIYYLFIGILKVYSIKIYLVQKY